MTRSDQLGRIRSALVEAKSVSDQFNVSFNVWGKYTAWVRVTEAIVTTHYPFPDHPSEAIRGLSSFSKKLCIERWEPHNEVELSFEKWDPDELSAWIDRYFINVLECESSTYAVRIGYDATISSESFDSTFFHPDDHYINDNRAITMKAGGSWSTAIWDGSIVVESDNSDHALWLWIFSQEIYQREGTMITNRYLDVLRPRFLSISTKPGEDTHKPELGQQA